MGAPYVGLSFSFAELSEDLADKLALELDDVPDRPALEVDDVADSFKTAPRISLTDARITSFALGVD